jgi:glycogen synthase
VTLDASSSPLAVLRLCSVFEAPDDALHGRSVRFDPIGGMQNHTAQLTRALDALGVRQEVITSRPPGAPRRHQVAVHALVRRFGLPVRWARQLYSIPAGVAAWRAARGFDLIHAHLGEDLAVLPIAVAAARRGELPLVVTIHTSLRHTFGGSGLRARVMKTVGGRIEVEVCRHAAAVIALTERLAARIRDERTASERIHIIPPGVNSAEFESDAHDPFPEVGHPRIVYVGRLAYQKGLDTLVEAVAQMRSPAAQVLLVGDGPKRPELEAEIARHRLSARVRITGFKPHREIPAILRHAEVFCLPSRFEECSSVLLEAMRAGVPIVATDVGGASETLGRAGRLVPPGQPHALAAAIDELLTEPAEAARLAAAARERASRYEWSRLAAETLSVYRAALTMPARQSRGAGTIEAQPR